MGDLLQLIFFGHVHKWETVKTQKMEKGNAYTGSSVAFVRYTMRCTVCGNMKTFNTCNGG